MKMQIVKRLSAALFLVGVVSGCEGRTAILPNSDGQLNKSPVKFAVDAAKRHYEADAPSGGEAEARGEANYTLKQLSIGNLSQEDWKDVEIWINQKYVVFLPSIPKFNKADGIRTIKFQMFYDNTGEHFPASLFSSKVIVDKLQIFRDGKMYDVPLRLAD